MTPAIAPWQVWWADFDPQLGREQAGRRPAIVVGSEFACRLPNGLALVVPCTSTDRGLPTRPRVLLDGPSVAMCDHVKSVDRARLKKLHSTVLKPSEIEAIRFVLGRLIA